MGIISKLKAAGQFIDRETAQSAKNDKARKESSGKVVGLSEHRAKKSGGKR